MKNKHLNFFILFVFFTLSLYSQEEKQNPNEKEKNDYQASVEKQKKLYNQYFEKDFQQKLRIARELEDINPEMSYQRYLEVIFLYPEYFKNPQYSEKILSSLFNYFFLYKSIDDFYNFLEELKRRGIIDEKLEEKIKQDYSSKF
jgi:hypothetical protein